MNNLHELYGKDYTAWANQMAELIKAGKFAELDIEHLLEELQSMGASEQRELENRLRVLLAHLLKWQFQYRQLAERWKEFEGKSWRNTIITQRLEIQVLLRKHPGVKKFLPDAVTEAYQDARELAAAETGLPMQTFPSVCPYSREQILDREFYPAWE
jgi:hypothetical protein